MTPGEPHAYLTEINLGAHLGRLPEELRTALRRRGRGSASAARR